MHVMIDAMSVVLEGPFAIAAAVLVVSGVLKLRDPEPTKRMLAALFVKESRDAPRSHSAMSFMKSTPTTFVVALGEIGVGVLAFVNGGWVTAVLVETLFVAFGVVSVVLLRRGGEIGCGCFGQKSTRITGAHVAVNFGAALVAGAAAATNVPGFIDARAEFPWAGIPQLGFIALGAALVIAIMTVLPEVRNTNSYPRSL